ncbi:SRPBCC family protein [Asticcacaulis sp. AND118]|uniref:SRPBCC family protein n=1 Tax=Asticcacaulis sp. AND118 TaxID=2840468 RepID=UPI001CFFAEB5|nr:SRPBCC family protein [Asticcacaulis sp. AND118]UDF04980.1 SRPBCC family protein [Asticcacaulis sp. AND118]
MFDSTPLSLKHSIDIPLPLDECFDLFTPHGETLWIAEWKPEYIHPRDGQTVQGMVFLTYHGAETTHWTIVDYRPHQHYVRYSRVTAGSRSVLIEVQCIPQGACNDDTRVWVAYTLVPMSEKGVDDVRSFQGENYVAMIERWRTMILTYLDRREAGA